ncbi:MAG: hypothetical protein V4727_00640 [Verrucomicrobiota bacterium]
MKTISNKSHPRGYVSLIAVFTLSIFMLAMMAFAYKRAINAQATLSDIQTQTDYREKEETILRSIVAIVPNHAIQAMQDGSDDSETTRDAVSFEAIFEDAIEQSNARASISEEFIDQMDEDTVFRGNSGDSALTDTTRIFKSALGNSGSVSGGLNRSFGSKYPPALNFSGTLPDDDNFPIISNFKQYGALADGEVSLDVDTYKDFNLIPYPQIDFGYAQPGELFVAKRNWWAFKMNLSAHDDTITNLSRYDRTFVLSIYEIPSQLPISAGSFMALGQYADGSAWENVSISGNVFASRAVVEGETDLASLASRRGFELSGSTTIGGQTFNGSPFAPGVRETYRLTEGDFFPVSLASESGKAAFVPINRGVDFYDRYAHIEETTTISPTTWNEYSVGAMQCAMRLDITGAVSATDPTPSELTFSYMKSGARVDLVLPLDEGVATDLPVGYIFVANENASANFPTPVDVAYGASGSYFFRESVSGTVMFDNGSFGDPFVGAAKSGYFKPRYPFEMKTLPTGRKCVAVYPERFKDFLELLGADSLEVNNSLAVNVDYVNNSTTLDKPFIPSTAVDYGVILQECADLTTFTKGFSLVTNLPLHLGDDFNVVAMSPPAGYVPPGGALFYPPSSLFSPEKRYGVGMNPLAVEFSGQVGSTASEDSTVPIRPLDTKTTTGSTLAASNITMNLSAISHPAELPPITMKNWLIVIEEMGRDYADD